MIKSGVYRCHICMEKKWLHTKKKKLINCWSHDRLEPNMPNIILVINYAHLILIGNGLPHWPQWTSLIGILGLFPIKWQMLHHYYIPFWVRTYRLRDMVIIKFMYPLLLSRNCEHLRRYY
jgi:hypothetical protein